MTARDFTPTDEHMQNLAEDYAGVLGLRDDFRRGDESDAYLLVVDGLATSPAFQSIIAAAKAEALRDLADEYRRSMKFATDHRIDAGLMILHIEKRANEISEASA